MSSMSSHCDKASSTAQGLYCKILNTNRFHRGYVEVYGKIMENNNGESNGKDNVKLNGNLLYIGFILQGLLNM